jgi:hypothetical protein
VVDLLHKWDIGGGKAVIVHLFRILTTIKRQGGDFSSILTEVDKRLVYLAPTNHPSLIIYVRYRHIPTFGHHIRGFSKNVSEMKKMTAHNLENILQVHGISFKSQ